MNCHTFLVVFLFRLEKLNSWKRCKSMNFVNPGFACMAMTCFLAATQQLAPPVPPVDGGPRNYSHRSFLDGAWKRDMDIIVGLSDWGFIQGPDPCDRPVAEDFDITDIT